MDIRQTGLEGLLEIEPKVNSDDRGFLTETYQSERYARSGIPVHFVQDNLSHSNAGVLRGLHFQHPRGQAKLVQVLVGEVFDVAVDIRYGSPTFGRWSGVTLSADNALQLFIPTGFAHGFCVLSDSALFSYKCSALYSPQSEITLRWNDPDIGIDWPIETPRVSTKDMQGMLLRDIDTARLPDYGA